MSSRRRIALAFTGASGAIYGLRVLEELVQYMRSRPGVWFATHEQIARYVKDQAG
mgnify:CR=1 FL=1